MGGPLIGALEQSNLRSAYKGEDLQRRGKLQEAGSYLGWKQGLSTTRGLKGQGGGGGDLNPEAEWAWGGAHLGGTALPERNQRPYHTCYPASEAGGQQTLDSTRKGQPMRTQSHGEMREGPPGAELLFFKKCNLGLPWWRSD